MVETNFLLTLLQTLSIMVGIGYYVTTLRNQQKNQAHTEETRKLQLLIGFNRNITEQGSIDYNTVMRAEWDDKMEEKR